MLTGVGRPGMSRGLIEDVRDALEGSAWYLRLEGGRYRFTAEPTLNKVVMEREGAIPEQRIRQLVREAIGTVAAGKGPIKVVPRVEESADLPDDQILTLGILDPDLRVGPETRAETLGLARKILEERGGVFRANKNAAMLVAADDAAMRKARASARTLAALGDIRDDRHRLSRFNKEQREQLDKRLAATEQRLPQQVVMAYRHLLMLADQAGGLEVEHVDLGPARVDARISDRVLDYLRSADRIAENTLAPAALLAERFGLLAADAEAVELDQLLAAFAKLPRLPKLAGPHVLRSALAQGVAQGLFGLASGTAWNAPDAVRRFREPVIEDEIHFQPGTFLVRAAAIEPLVAPADREKREAATVGPTPTPDTDDKATPGGGTTTPDGKATLAALSIDIRGVPATKARELLRAAILPLAKSYADVSIDVTISASGGDGVARSELDLTVLESLRQLGVENVELHER